MLEGVCYWAKNILKKRENKEESSDKKEIKSGTYHSNMHDLSLMDKEDFKKYLRMNTSAAIPILLLYLNKN